MKNLRIENIKFKKLKIILLSYIKNSKTLEKAQINKKDIIKMSIKIWEKIFSATKVNLITISSKCRKTRN